MVYSKVKKTVDAINEISFKRQERLDERIKKYYSKRKVNIKAEQTIARVLLRSQRRQETRLSPQES